MTKPVGSKCNLDCTYCFYLEKEHPYAGESDFRMKPEVLEAYIRDYIAAQPTSVVSFAWQGGEPTLAGVDFFRRVVELQQRHTQGRAIENALQTNGTLLDDEWGEFLAQNKFLVGLSIDGPAHLHDAYCVDKGNKPTFDKAIAGLAVPRKHGVEFNTLTTVHRKNSTQPLEVYRFLRSAGSGYIQFIPIVERNASLQAAEASGLWLAPPPDHGDADALATQVTDWSVRPADYGKFLTTIFDEWVQRDVGRIFVQQFDAALANWVGGATDRSARKCKPNPLHPPLTHRFLSETFHSYETKTNALSGHQISFASRKKFVRRSLGKGGPQSAHSPNPHARLSRLRPARDT